MHTHTPHTSTHTHNTHTLTHTDTRTHTHTNMYTLSVLFHILNALTLNMTKYGTVPTNKSDDVGNIVTEMEPWGTSAVFSELELITACMHALITRDIYILYIL